MKTMRNVFPWLDGYRDVPAYRGLDPDEAQRRYGWAFIKYMLHWQSLLAMLPVLLIARVVVGLDGRLVDFVLLPLAVLVAGMFWSNVVHALVKRRTSQP